MHPSWSPRPIPSEAMFTRVWRFQPAPGAERKFVETYGSHGEWAKLFALADGYLGTKLERLDDGSGTFQTTDRWASRAAWERFLADHSDEYDALDRASETLTATEVLVGEFVEYGG